MLLPTVIFIVLLPTVIFYRATTYCDIYRANANVYAMIYPCSNLLHVWPVPTCANRTNSYNIIDKFDFIDNSNFKIYDIWTRSLNYGFLEMFYLPCSMEHQFMSKNLCSVIHINFKMFYVPCSMEFIFLKLMQCDSH